MCEQAATEHADDAEKQEELIARAQKMEKTAKMNPWGRLLHVETWRMMMTIKAWLHHHPQLIRT